jgi:hypothetical protein
MSYRNLLLYSSATPQYDDEKSTWDSSLDANNPDNFTSGGSGSEEAGEEDEYEEEDEVKVKDF